MTKEEYEEAAQYWITRDKEGKKGSREQLYLKAVEYIRGNNTCALATGGGSSIRCTPVEYEFHDNAFWIFTEGGLKFRGLEESSQVSLAVYDKYAGFGKLKGMQIMGTAELIEPFSEAYDKAAVRKNIPPASLRKLPHPIHLLCIHPTYADFLNSDFKEEGLDSRQRVEF